MWADVLGVECLVRLVPKVQTQLDQDQKSTFGVWGSPTCENRRRRGQVTPLLAGGVLRAALVFSSPVLGPEYMRKKPK